MISKAALLSSTTLSSGKALMVSGDTVWLFAAGASAFCKGVSPVSPPLGNKLFDQLCAFDPFFRGFDPDLQAAFRRNFEEGMRMFDSNRNGDRAQLHCLMALYFLQFKISDESVNFYSRFASMVGGLPGRHVLSTLNYDLLLDYALLRKGLLKSWGFEIIKLHGAPNYLFEEGQMRRTMNITFVNSEMHGSVRPASPQEAERYCKDALANGGGFAPCIASYAVGKRVDHGPHTIGGMHARFKDAVHRAAAVILVGVFLNRADTHIWEPLATSKASIGFVNPDPSLYVQWSRETRRPVQQICGTADQLVTSQRAALHRFILEAQSSL